MENNQAVQTVKQMQAFIKEHINENIGAEDVAASVGYSLRQAQRLFRQHLNLGIAQYIRAMRLTLAAKRLSTREESVLDVALTHHFSSHEGFTKAFASRFGLTPKEYRHTLPPIRFFTPFPPFEKSNFNLEGAAEMNKNTRLCMITPVSRPKRKLIYLPSKTATDYLSFCEEKGCEWDGLLNSIHVKMDTAAFITMEGAFAGKIGCAGAAAVEVPHDYAGKVPDGYLTMDLEPCTLLYFQSEPYENEDDYCIYIEQVFHAQEKYNPSMYGYSYDFDNCPFFNFGAYASTGARIAVPVKAK